VDSASETSGSTVNKNGTETEKEEEYGIRSEQPITNEKSMSPVRQPRFESAKLIDNAIAVPQNKSREFDRTLETSVLIDRHKDSEPS
jgi:hypothetical protein